MSSINWWLGVISVAVIVFCGAAMAALDIIEMATP